MVAGDILSVFAIGYAKAEGVRIVAANAYYFAGVGSYGTQGGVGGAGGIDKKSALHGIPRLEKGKVR